jgi:ferredoxin
MCGICAEECPSDAIEEDNDIYIINQDECTGCGTCLEICPTEAIIEEQGNARIFLCTHGVNSYPSYQSFLEKSPFVC